MAMKLSRLDEASTLKTEIRRLDSMMEFAAGFPRCIGYLTINGKSIPLPHPAVDELLRQHSDLLAKKAADLDVEMDE